MLNACKQATAEDKRSKAGEELEAGDSGKASWNVVQERDENSGSGKDRGRGRGRGKVKDKDKDKHKVGAGAVATMSGDRLAGAVLGGVEAWWWWCCCVCCAVECVCVVVALVVSFWRSMSGRFTRAVGFMGERRVGEDGAGSRACRVLPAW
ncbi:hypothetical protein F4823DRAFT_611476 [Ustulina deusta]|nr:hypothetical protein F4823DRAFT_611476 [Ustulina deusta]